MTLLCTSILFQILHMRKLRALSIALFYEVEEKYGVAKIRNLQTNMNDQIIEGEIWRRKVLSTSLEMPFSFVY